MLLAVHSGEAFQFDRSKDGAVIDGERTKLQVAHFKFSHSSTKDLQRDVLSKFQQALQLCKGCGLHQIVLEASGASALYVIRGAITGLSNRRRTVTVQMRADDA